MIRTCRSNIQCLQIIKIKISFGHDHDQSSERHGPIQASTTTTTPSTAEQLILQLMDRWTRLLGDLESRGETTLNEDARHIRLNDVNKKTTTTTRKILNDAAVREDISKLREEMLQMESMQNAQFNQDSINSDFANMDERVNILKVCLIVVCEYLYNFIHC